MDVSRVRVVDSIEELNIELADLLINSSIESGTLPLNLLAIILAAPIIFLALL